MRTIQSKLSEETGATLTEYVIAVLGIAIPVALIVGFLELSIATRVNSGRDCYTSYQIQDPGVDPTRGCN